MATNNASLTFPVRAGSLKVNDLVVLGRDRPCKVVELSRTQSGKHGTTKTRLVALDIVNGRKYSHFLPSHSTLPAPSVRRWDAMCIDITAETMSVLTEEGEQRLFGMHEVLEVAFAKARELMEATETGVTVTVVEAMGLQFVASAKEDK